MVHASAVSGLGWQLLTMEPSAVAVHARAVYDVTALPPLDAGAAHVTATDALPAVAATVCGAVGTRAGVTATRGVEAALSPSALFAIAST